MVVRLSTSCNALYSPETFLFISVCGSHFCSKMRNIQDLVQLERLCKLIKLNDLIGSWTCDLLACSTVPQPLCYSMHSMRIHRSKIWGFHGNDFEEWRLLGFYAIWFLQEPHSVTSQKTPFFRIQRTPQISKSHPQALQVRRKTNLRWYICLLTERTTVTPIIRVIQLCPCTGKT
jgi:hypothetical protein